MVTVVLLPHLTKPPEWNEDSLEHSNRPAQVAPPLAPSPAENDRERTLTLSERLPERGKYRVFWKAIMCTS